MFINVVCFLVGLGVYAWFAWLERKDMVKGVTKKVLTKFARMNICKGCCFKGFGKWLRESDESVEWATNPISGKKTLEIGSVSDGIEMGIKGGIKKQEKDDGNNARLVKENDALKAEMRIKEEENKSLKKMLYELHNVGE